MYEELYIIKNGERVKLDLNTPSGITLNFKSNIFGDLSKITCSYSYTFKLPLTLNNRLALDNADDIRASSKMTRKRLVAEFHQNGIKIFDDANLYIDTLDSSFQAVMTWGVIRGMDALKDNDISLREIQFQFRDPRDAIARYGIKTAVPTPQSWDNTNEYFIPLRKLESSYIYNQERYVYKRDIGSGQLPVVPVNRIIQAINDYYGTTFYFGEAYSGSRTWDAQSHSFRGVEQPDIVAFGVVPLVNRGLTDEQYEERTGTLKNVKVLNNTIFGITLTIWDDLKVPNVLGYDYTAPDVNDYFDIGNNGSSTTKKFTFFKKNNSIIEKAAIDGYIRVAFSTIGERWKGSKLEYSKTDVVPKLIVHRRKFQLKEGSSTNGEYVWEDAASLEGKFSGYHTDVDGDYIYNYYIFEFDFREAEGRKRLEIEDFSSSSVYPFLMAFDYAVQYTEEVSEFKIIPGGNLSDNINSGWETDIVSNLPDVSALTFMKALYYMLGAFPMVDSQGRIIPHYYSDLYQKVYSDKALDWSSKLCSAPGELPSKIAYSVSGFGQRNYYLMKNDDLENKSDRENEDVYESGMGCIYCQNETLEKNKTIIQLPWYGAFLKDASRPSMETGRDMKYQKYNDDDTTSFNEAKPAIGIVCPVEECTYKTPITNPPTCIPQGTYAMLLHIWDGFKTIDENPSYDALQTIMNDPIVITEYVNLNELDIRDIDYSVPIYLHKYNAYFALVSIQRDANGKSKCEFLKLP